MLLETPIGPPPPAPDLPPGMPPPPFPDMPPEGDPPPGDPPVEEPGRAPPVADPPLHRALGRTHARRLRELHRSACLQLPVRFS